MELQAVGATNSERLIDALIAAGKQLRARRQSERVVMPMKHREHRPGRPKHDVATTGVGQRHAAKAHLARCPGEHLRAERAGKQLGAKTDSEHGHVRGNGRGEQVDLRCQMRMRLGIADGHRPAEHDEPGDLLKARNSVVAVEMTVIELEPMSPRLHRDESGALEGNML